MSGYSDPQARLRELEAQLRRLQSEHRSAVEKIQKDANTRITALESRYKQLLRDQQQKTDAAYRDSLARMQEQLLSAHRQQLDQLEAQEEQARQKREALMRQQKEALDELKAQVQSMREKRAQEKASARAFAEKYIHEARQAEKKADLTPHNFFKPDEMDVLRSMLAKVDSQMTSGVYEAAAASAASATAELELLEAQVRALQEEWTQLFERYAADIQRLWDTMEAFRREELPSIVQPRKIDEESRGYWSCGAWTAISEEIASAHKAVQGAKEEGLPAYLKSMKAPRQRQLLHQMRDARRMEDRLLAAITAVRQEMALSDARYQAGEYLLEALEGLGYAILRAGFKEADGAEQPLNSYEIEARLGEETTLRIALIPLREDGVARRNECLITVHMAHPQPLSMAQMTQSWRSRAAQALHPMQSEPITLHCEAPEAPVVNQLKRQEQLMRPDPEAYAQRLEKKY